MKALVWATIDTLSCLLLVVLAAINPPVVEQRSAIETTGKWVVVTTWRASDNDVDTWLQQPDGVKVWWQNMRSASAHLEQDDVGVLNDDPDAKNRERVVIRSVQAGEYIVNLHGYAIRDAPVVVTVTLWRLQGADRQVHSVKITIRGRGQEETAFRFRLNERGELQDLNQLSARLVIR